ncbi:MAG: right-handed parallel beta-helix repeat-containing protein [Clostridium sp.]|nr:right-handed parallel beta-helix repeat-containing protein [Clostridium sp.]MCM1398466.1 right-handed parallel beta-helix repeat-containing protein [Clostridium sp.]MCM1460188.1 right-handed parallel beta-helix repeat-containing protein [Bacteroides sp.]
MGRKSNDKKHVLFSLMACILLVIMLCADVTCQAAAKVPGVGGVSAKSKTYNSVEVKWKAAKGVTGYEIYRSASKNKGYKKIATIKKNSELIFTDKKLTTGKTYYYKIRAYYKSGRSVKYGSYSKVVSVKPVPAKTTISSITSVDYKTLKLKWKAVTGASGYCIYKCTSKNGKYTLAKTVSGKNKVSANITNLAGGRTYYFKIRAYKTVGGKQVLGASSAAKSGYSVPVAAEIATIELNSLKSATLTWKFVSGSSGYYIYRSNSESSGYTKIGTITNNSIKEFTDNTIVKGSTYYYKVSAYREADGKKVEGEKSKAKKLRVVNSYTISPSSAPYAGNYTKNSNYNSNTKNYFTILSYMQLFERLGGGELKLNAGTYGLWKPIYIPSNTTIRFSDGVTIKSTATSSGNYGMFVLAAPSIMETSKKYYGYNGVHDVKLIGTGTVVFDKEYKKNSALLIGHTKNILIDGITFKNMDGGTHFIELDASQNVVVQNCKFTGYKDTGAIKEAINIDTPDSITGGFSGTYSSMDKTANDGVVIRNNVFDNVPTAVGTHAYSDGHPHKGIEVTGNTIRNCKYYGIRAMNWQDSYITNNKIDKISGDEDSLVIEMRGVSNVEVSGNSVKNSDRFMIIKVATYSQSTIASHPGLSSYKPVYNSVKEEDVVYNTLENVQNDCDIYYANTLDFSDKENWSVQ